MEELEVEGGSLEEALEGESAEEIEQELKEEYSDKSAELEEELEEYCTGGLLEDLEEESRGIPEDDLSMVS